MGRKIYNDGLTKWQRYRLRLKEKGIINKHNNRPSSDKKQYRLTYSGRALSLLHGYTKSDIKHNRGECTLTKDWIIDNIFSGQKCVYCGEDDWLKLGCDRIDNSKPHTPDNVVCCCKECNNERQKQVFKEFYRNKKGLTSPS